MADYVNRPAPGGPSSGPQKGRDRLHTETKLVRLAMLGFGLLCLLQAILNLSLRLSSQELASGVLRRLQGRLNATLVDKAMLEARITTLLVDAKKLQEEKEALRWRMTQKTAGDCSGRTCPPEWREIGSGCYFLSVESRDWPGSRKDCLDRGGDLVVINSHEEQEDLYRIDNDVDLLFWIGLYDREATGRLTWVDGSTMNVTFWRAGQPDRGGPDHQEDCVELSLGNPALASWNDAPCGCQLRWLCERDPCQ